MYDTDGNLRADFGLSTTSADGVSFLNVQHGYLWSGVEFAPDTVGALAFGLYDGFQFATWKDIVYYPWAVRSGDVAAAPVPEPTSLLLLLSGLLGFGVVRQRFR